MSASDGMCSEAIAGPASLEAWRWLVSSTDMIATPHELAICWVMLSSVEPRATSWAFRVFSAEVNSGIIVAPMPRPITNSSAMITGYGVVAVELGQPEHADQDDDQAERHDPADRELVDREPAIGIVIIAPMPCGATSRPACSVDSPRTSWK